MKKIIIISITVILLGGAAALVWGNRPDAAAVPSYVQARITQADAQSFSEAKAELAGMEGVLSNGLLSLYYNATDTGIAVRNDRTGEVWYSNPPDLAEDPIATGAIKNAMRSPVSLTYYNRSRQKARMTSYGDSVAYRQVSAEPIEGGWKVTYQFGKPVSDLDKLPQKISKARYEKIMEQAGDSYRRHLINAYVIKGNAEVYERFDDALKGTVLKRTLEAFELTGYTEEDLAQDNEEHQIAIIPNDSEKYKVSIEYVLDGADFLVRVPMDEVEYSADTPLTHLSVLEYFGAGGATDQGYLFVPDGSGSLIHMNKEDTVLFPYEQRIYGEDLAVRNPDAELPAVTEIARLPVFGMKRNEGGMLAIIESGASTASVKATTNGLLNSYNHVYAEFELLAREVIRIEAGKTSRELPTYQERPMAADVVIRYVFLEGDQANYTGMAHAYQNYLVERGLLTKRGDAEEDLPFYLEIVGAIPKQKRFLGVPYDTIQSLTTFEQAQEILELLRHRSLRNVKLQYTGWFNGGVPHSVPNEVSPENVLGGKRGLEALNAFSRENGVALYPDVSMTRLYPQSSLTYSPTQAAVRRLNRSVAELYPYDPATGYRDREKPPEYLLAPQILPGLVDRFANSYRAYDLQGLSLRDLGDRLYSNFRAGYLSDRTQTERVMVSQAEKLQARLPETELMVSGGNAYLLPYARHIVDAPMSDSGFHMTDEAVPFYQIVLRGYVDYAGAPYNLTLDTDLREYVLKCLEYGSNLRFTWIYESNALVKETPFNYLYSVHYANWIDSAAAAYQEVNEVLKDAAGSRIVSHEKLADHVYRTVYEGGKTIIVNYNPYAVKVEGITIEARGYEVGGEGP